MKTFTFSVNYVKILIKERKFFEPTIHKWILPLKGTTTFNKIFRGGNNELHKRTNLRIWYERYPWL